MSGSNESAKRGYPLCRMQALTIGKEYVLLYDKAQDLYTVKCGDDVLYYEIGNPIEAINAFINASTCEIKLRAMKKMLARGQNPFTGEWCLSDDERDTANQAFEIYCNSLKGDENE